MSGGRSHAGERDLQIRAPKCQEPKAESSPERRLRGPATIFLSRLLTSCRLLGCLRVGQAKRRPTKNLSAITPPERTEASHAAHRTGAAAPA
jgi:hypothetical protein